MKKINFENLNERNDYALFDFIERGVNMEFIKKGENYLIKNSNGRVVSEKEKLELENGELAIKDITSDNCQAEATKKIKKNKKRIKKIIEEDLKNKNLIKEVETYDTLEETAEII